MSKINQYTKLKEKKNNNNDSTSEHIVEAKLQNAKFTTMPITQ